MKIRAYKQQAIGYSEKLIIPTIGFLSDFYCGGNRFGFSLLWLNYVVRIMFEVSKGKK